MGKCSLCIKTKNIIYYDYEFYSKSSVKLCYSCLKMLGWGTELKELLPRLHTCPECHQKYISKKANPIKCGVCWSKYFGTYGARLIDVLEGLPEEKPQHELMAYV